MALPFRRRIFVVLVVMTVVPTLLAVAGWVLSVRRLLPAAGARASTERVASTARMLLDGVDTLHLTLRKRALLRHFGTLKAIERAALADLAKVPGISAETARKIYDFFHERAG